MTTPMPVIQFQILAKNPERAAEFYGRVFGWRINADNALAYRRIETGGLEGGIWPAPPEAPSFVQLFVEVADLHALIESAVAAGATVVIPPSQLPEGDEMAVIVDPEGVPFGIFKRKSPSLMTGSVKAC